MGFIHDKDDKKNSSGGRLRRSSVSRTIEEPEMSRARISESPLDSER